MQARWLRSVRAPLAQGHALDVARARLEQAWGGLHAARERRLERSALALRHLNPEAVLERGFAIVTTIDNAVVQRSDTLSIGESLRIRFARGSASASVTDKD